MDLTQDQMELLNDLLVSDYWPVVQKVVEFSVQKLEGAVLNYDLGQGTEGLVRRKAQLEGARAIPAFLEQLKRKRKKEEKNATG